MFSVTDLPLSSVYTTLSYTSLESNVSFAVPYGVATEQPVNNNVQLSIAKYRFFINTYLSERFL